MSKLVFILGAGASAMAGAPLMNNFLDVARDLFAARRCGDVTRDFETVFTGIDKLQNVHSKAELDIQNLESVFGAFEMARTLGQFGSLNSEEIQNLGPAMKRVIVKTLEETITYPIVRGTKTDDDPSSPYPLSETKVLPPRPYDTFAKLLGGYRYRPSRTAAIITFNYDVAVDYALHFNSLKTDYALSGNTEDLPLLKLHGSLNWARCSKCDKVVPWSLGEFLQTHSFDPVSVGFANSAKLPIGTQLKAWSHCGQAVDGQSALVPPTWSKAEYHRTIATVWSRAAKELSEAESIFVIGFSLPSTDAFFQYLYALGSVGRPLRRFWVFNKEDKGGGVHNRFKALLGPGAKERFEYVAATFETSIGMIATELELVFDAKLKAFVRLKN